MRHFSIITTLLVAIFSISCDNYNSQDSSIEEAATTLIEKIDSNSLRLLKEYKYAHRGTQDFWRKLPFDSASYACSYKAKNDTIELEISQPFNFIKDFESSYHFDTAQFYFFSFIRLNDSIIRITEIDHDGNHNIKDTSFSFTQLFPRKDPFLKFRKLTVLKDTLGFIGTSYNQDIGDFMIFYLKPYYKLTYMPDTMLLNPISKRSWIDEFQRGKLIKKSWSLTQLPMN